MKTTKKLLMILCAITVLAATVFTVASTALVAGEGTTMNEYLNMKKVSTEDYEDGACSVYSGVANLGNVPGQYQSLVGKVHTISQARSSVAGIYDAPGTQSTKFYVIDYHYNTGTTMSHLYVQPKLGVLDNIDKTPVNGFVSEFDIAFFSPVETEMQKKTETVKDPVTGEEVTKFVTQTVYGDNGEPVIEPAWEIDPATGEDKLDAEGNKIPIWEIDEATGAPKLDENGEKIQETRTQTTFVMTPVLVPMVDEAGNPILDSNGNQVMGEKNKKLPFVGFGATFSVEMYNTHTYKDGSVGLLTFPTTAASATSEGSIKIAVSGTNLLANAPTYTFAPDTWQHITIQYDANNLLTSIYVGRDTDEGGRILIATVSALDTSIDNKGGAEGPVYPLQFRIGATTDKGIVGLDNFLSYQGKTVHDPDLIKEKMNNEQILIHFADILENENTAAVVRHQAFLDIGEYVIDEFYIATEDKYTFNPYDPTKAELFEACETYKKYKADTDGILSDLIASACEDNVKSFKQFVDNALGVARKLDNISTRQVRISMASDFLTSVGVYIDRTSQDFKDSNAALKALEAQVAADTAANEFVAAMKLFTSAVNYGASVSRITYHYNNALALRDSICDYNDIKTSDVNGYNSLKEAVDAFDGNEASGIKSASDLIIEANLTYNSSRFVNIISILKNTTETDWKNDDGSIEKLWYLALNIERVEGVDVNYEGYASSKLIFDEIHKFFWAELQKRHIAVIEAKLDGYNGVNSSYIDKAGICTYVDKYIDQNEADIDLENANLARLIEKNETYKEQLTTLVGDYKNLLTQNTTKFANAMKAATQFNTYAELKPLYEEATEYYYSMDIVGEGIEDYVALYEALRAQISAIEADSSMFVAIVENGIDGVCAPLAEITDKTELYVSLNACIAYTGNLDDTYEGVAAARATYDAKYAEYMGTVEMINGQLDQTLNTACAARGMWDIDAIVAFVNSLFD